MNDVKMQIKAIESNIQFNLDKLTYLKRSLKEKVASIKMNIVLTEMIALGFTVGYIMIPAKNATAKGTRFALAILLLKSRKIASRVMRSLLGQHRIY